MAAGCNAMLRGSIWRTAVFIVLVTFLNTQTPLASGIGAGAKDKEIVIVPVGSAQLASFAVTKPGPFANELQMLKITSLTQLVLTTTKILTQRQLTNWAMESTLLGIYRHAALLPYDDEAHIGVLAPEFELVIKVLAEQFGESRLTVNGTIARITSSMNYPERRERAIVCRVNIYAFEHDAKGGILRNPSVKMQTAPVAEMFPVSSAKLQNSFVPVPSASVRILARTYGAAFAFPDKTFDWRTMSYVPSANATNMHEFPLVSVIMPTYNRAQFLKKTVELLQRQDYPNIELIIVDDSPLQITEEAAQWKQMLRTPWIRYYHLPERISIGAKRNLAVKLAAGQIIVHWDDDDYYREFRITQQIAPIMRQEAEVTVLEHHYYFEILAGQFYIVKRLHSWGPHCGTLTYSKSVFAERNIRFPDNSIAEDYAFAELAILSGANLLVMDNTDGKHVYVRHHNTWQFNLAKEYAALILEVPRPWFFAEADYEYYVHLKLDKDDTGQPPNNHAWSGILWTLPQLQPLSEHSTSSVLQYPTYAHYPQYSQYGQYPHYPHYPHYPQYSHYDPYPHYPQYYPRYPTYQAHTTHPLPANDIELQNSWPWPVFGWIHGPAAWNIWPIGLGRTLLGFTAAILQIFG